MLTTQFASFFHKFIMLIRQVDQIDPLGHFSEVGIVIESNPKHFLRPLMLSS